MTRVYRKVELVSLSQVTYRVQRCLLELVGHYYTRSVNMSRVYTFNFISVHDYGNGG